MQSKNYFVLVLVFGLGMLTCFLLLRSKSKAEIEQTGGVRLTYQMLLRPDQRPRADEIRQHLLRTMEKRVSSGHAIGGVSISPKGEDEIVIDLPGVVKLDPEVGMFGTSGKIQFYWAKNVVTDMATYRHYRAIDDPLSASPQVYFQDNYLGATAPKIKFGSQEYLQVIRGWDLILEGDDLRLATSETQGSKEVPLMTFSKAGAMKMRTWSVKHENHREGIAAVLDGKVISLAFLEDDVILSDNAMITGPAFTHEYVRTLCELLNSGSLPIELKLIRTEKFEPKIRTTGLSPGKDR